MKVVLICRPKLIINDSDKYANIEEIGFILSALVEKMEGNPKETKPDTSMKRKTIFVRLRRSTMSRMFKSFNKH